MPKPWEKTQDVLCVFKLEMIQQPCISAECTSHSVVWVQITFKEESRLRSRICGGFVPMSLCLLEYEINLKQLVQSLNDKFAPDVGDGSVFLGCLKGFGQLAVCCHFLRRVIWNGSTREVRKWQLWMFPKKALVKIQFTHGISLAFFPHKCLANGAEERLLESQDCSKDRAGTSVGFAAVLFMWIGGSIYGDVVSDLAYLSVPKTSLGMVSCGTVERSGSDCQKWVCCSSWVSCWTEGVWCSQQPC